MEKSLQKFFCNVLLLVLLSAIVSIEGNAQSCTPPAVGCNNTDFSNSYLNSSNPNTIEYDNMHSSFHATFARQADGTVLVWGERMANNGTSHILSPQELNSTNYPLLTGTVLKFASGSYDKNLGQYCVLTTTGLFVWGGAGNLISTNLKSSSSFGSLTVGGNATGLPPGVTPAEVKMLFGSAGTLVITTCSGNVWVLSTSGLKNGDGTGDVTGTTDIVWHKVKTNASGNPDLTGIVAARGSSRGLIALKDDGTIWTWGQGAYLGDGTAYSAFTYATQMEIPTGVTPKMIGGTVYSGGGGSLMSYYLLADDGSLFSIGMNSMRQLGDFTTTQHTSWTQVQKSATPGDYLENVAWISPVEHSFYAKSTGINILTSTGQVYAWGLNDENMFGLPTTGSNNPTANPGGLTPSDNIIAIETGGHTSIVVKQCLAQYGYVGHHINGSMSDGSGGTGNEAIYNFTNTSILNLCSAPVVPVITASSSCTSPSSPVTLTANPSGGTYNVISGNATISDDNIVTVTGLGQINIVYTSPSCTLTDTISINQINAGADGNIAVCSNNTATITLANLITGEQTGGVWTRLTGAGGTFTAASGTFVPAAGATTSTFRYIVSGTAPCGNDTSIATVTINICAVTISGTVFDDGNGNTIINAGETFTSLPVPLYVYLVNSSGIVVDSALVSPNGTYTLTANPNQNYTIELSTVQYPVGTNISATPINNTLPANWVTTGENGNNNTGSGDGHPNGVLSVNVGTAAIAHQNFGIEQRPDSDTITYHLPYAPNEDSDACLDGFSAPELSGSDPEDGTYTGANSTGALPQGVIITSLPTHGQLWYYGFGIPVVVSTSDVTDSTLFDPSLFCVVFTGCGYTGTTFEYAYVDAAGVADSTPATYTITWDRTDSVTLLATNPSCLSTGTVTISSPIGSDYTYSIDSISFQESPYFPGLTAGNYTFYVKKAGNTCISTQSITLTPAVCEPSYCNADLSWNNAEGEIGTYNVTTGDYTVLCTNDNIILGDIAIDQYGQMWGVGFDTDTLYRIDLSSCTFVPVTKVPVRAPNSLSVLPDGTFLMGSGNPYNANGNIVHRYNPVTDVFTVWNVFDESAYPDITHPSGDFIYIDGFVYVLWFNKKVDPTAPHIYKATVDANYNYISHEDLGAVQPLSYGLAKINGELYAVTSIGSATFEQTGTIIKIPLPNVEDWTVAYTGITSLFYGATSYQEVQALDLLILSDYDISNECPEVTVDLNALLTDTPPAGYSLVWFTNDTHSGTPLSTEQASNVGVGAYYYAYFYNEEVDCYSPVSAPVLVTIDSCPVITGTVFKDANGNTIINTGEIFTSLPVPLYVYLVGSNGIVVDSAEVAPNGTYLLQASANQNYTIELSTVQYPIGANTATTPIDHTPPVGWVNTGENGDNNTGPGDGSPNGILAVSVETSNVSDQNFGIQQPPVADNKSYHVPNSAFSETPPFGYPDISSPGARYFMIATSDSMLTGYTHNGSLTGRDEEDCSAVESCNTGSTFVLDSLYDGTILFYNFGGEVGVRQLVEGDTIKNYGPSKLVIYALEGLGIGTTPVGFTYSIIDNAGFASPPAQYMILTESALPVELLYFTATVNACNVLLHWSTASELNNREFMIYRSSDAQNWIEIARVDGGGNSNVPLTYSHTDSPELPGVWYYRLIQTDFDGTEHYLPIVSVSLESCPAIHVKVFPNPASDYVMISGNTEITSALLLDISGRVARSYSDLQPDQFQKLDISGIESGLYWIIINDDKTGSKQKLVITH